MRDRIFRSKQPLAISGPEEAKSLGSADVITLLELLRVAHALDRNSTLAELDSGASLYTEPMDISLLHILREVMGDEPWLNWMRGGLVSLPPIPVEFNAESGFWLCKAHYRHHSALVRMRVPSIVAWSSSFQLLPPPANAVPKGVAFSPRTQLDHLLVGHDITMPLIRPQSVFDTGTETGKIFFFFFILCFCLFLLGCCLCFFE